MKCSTHSCSYRVFIVTATPPHTGVYRFVTNHRHSLLPVSAPTETHCRGQREAILRERTGAQQSCRLQIQKDRSLLRFLYHYGYCLCSKHILSVSLVSGCPPHCMDSGRNTFYGIDPSGEMKHCVIRRTIQLTNNNRPFLVIHILSLRPPGSPIVTQQQCARAELEISGEHRRRDVPGSAIQNYDFNHTSIGHNADTCSPWRAWQGREASTPPTLPCGSRDARYIQHSSSSSWRCFIMSWRKPMSHERRLIYSLLSILASRHSA